MVEKILNNTSPYGKIRASHEGSLHSSTLIHSNLTVELDHFMLKLHLCLFPVTRKSIFFKKFKTSFKSPPGGTGEYNLRCAHP